MKSIRSFLLSLVILMIPSLAISETVFYCSTELATGIAKHNGQWRTGSFKKHRFTLKVDGDWKSVVLKGGLESYAKCKRRWPHKKNYIVCNNTDDIFHFNIQTNKFLLVDTSPITYTTSEDGSDTSQLYVGKCETF